MFGLGVLALTSCSDPMDEITSLIVGRNFSPTNFEAKNVTRESASLQWTVSSGATSYNLEIFEDDSLAFEGTPVQTFTNISASQIPYLVEGLTYDTKYSARVMAVDDNDNSRNSVWNGVYFRTNAQQIFKTVDPLKDVLDRSATFYWPAGEAVTKIAAKFTDDNGRTTLVVSRNLTEEEIAAGKATVEGLSPATKYTINLYNGEKERGSKTITTIADMTGKTIVQEGENLKSILANAADGEQFVLMPGTYQIPSADDDGTTSSAVLKTNVSIEGMYPTAKPVIQGRFEINGAKSVEITNVILDGSQNNSADQTFNFKEAASDLQKLVVKDSEIKNYAKGLYYINVAAQIKEITFNDGEVAISGNMVNTIDSLAQVSQNQEYQIRAVEERSMKMSYDLFNRTEELYKQIAETDTKVANTEAALQNTYNLVKEQSDKINILNEKIADLEALIAKYHSEESK